MKVLDTLPKVLDISSESICQESLQAVTEKNPRSTYFIHQDRRLICCWNWSKICDCFEKKDKNSSTQKTKSSTLSELVSPLCPFPYFVLCYGWLRVILDKAWQVFTLNMKFQLAAHTRTFDKNNQTNKTVVLICILGKLMGGGGAMQGANT